MRPVLENSKLSHRMWILYLVIFLVCTIGIGVAMYMQFFKDENLGAVVGITSQDSKDEEKYYMLQEEFNTIFTNDIENLQNEEINIQKLNNNFDLVVTAFHYEKNEENTKINVNIPYLNINNNAAKEFNQIIRGLYKEQSETLMNQVSNIGIIYTVEYKAYIQNNILSLAIRCGFKEGNKSQKVVVQTFNYDLKQNREVALEEILKIKNITTEEANTRIKNKIKYIQEQNNALVEALTEDQKVSLYERDYNSEIYNISNSKQYLYGKDGLLYIIYAYGNDSDTNEMDIIIF